jgi:hypothetical protein
MTYSRIEAAKASSQRRCVADFWHTGRPWCHETPAPNRQGATALQKERLGLRNDDRQCAGDAGNMGRSGPHDLAWLKLGMATYWAL